MTDETPRTPEQLEQLHEQAITAVEASVLKHLDFAPSCSFHQAQDNPCGADSKYFLRCTACGMGIYHCATHQASIIEAGERLLSSVTCGGCRTTAPSNGRGFMALFEYVTIAVTS